MSAKGEKPEASQSSRAKLARRARSFKEEFLDKLSNIRSPSASRGGSPNKSPRLRHKVVMSRSATPPEDMKQKRKPEKDVHKLQKDVHFALRYFQDVVDKNTLEMLPGSASIVLETVVAIHNLLGSIPVNEQSSMLTSSCNQVYQSLANLIRWSDNVLLHGDQTHNKENINEVVLSVRDAIKTLVQLFVAKLQNKDVKQPSLTQNTLKTDLPVMASLPDIPLTPREKEILEQTNFTNLMDNHTPHSLSSDNILNNNNNDSLESDLPPPKPPLPLTRSGNSSLSNECNLSSVPPLPPKKRTQSTANDTSINIGHLSPLTSSPQSSLSSIHNQLTNMNNSMHSDWMNTFCQSPQSSTPLSRSPASSIASSLNRSAEELSRDTPSMTSSDYNGATGSIRLDISSSSSEHIEEINQLTLKISELTAQQEGQKFASPPPLLPLKQIKLRDRFPSQYDNIPDFNTMAEQMFSRSHTSFGRSVNFQSQSVFQSQSSTVHSSVSQRSVSVSRSSSLSSQQSFVQEGVNHTSVSQMSMQQSLRKMSQIVDGQASYVQSGQSAFLHSTATQTSLSSSSSDDASNKPPPLPPKKKHIMAYMQMFGSYSQPSSSEFFRHSMHSYNILQAQWQQREQFFQSRSLTFSYGSSSSDDWADRSISPEPEDIIPPALPPKKSKNTWHLPLVLPAKKMKATGNGIKERPSTSPTSPSPPIYGELREKSASMIESVTTDSEVEQEFQDSISGELPDDQMNNGVSEELSGETIPLHEIDVSDFLVYKKPGEEGPSLRGGSIDALIVQATRVTKNARPNNPCLKTNRAFYQREICTYFMYQEAFLTTYRTFITPKELIDKLLHRYNKFSHLTDLTKKRASRNTFSLLVRVVDELCINDINDTTIQTLMDFVFQLLCDGELMLAKILRTKILEKCNLRKKTTSQNIPLSSFGVSTVQFTLLDFKSDHLAEQMTLLDANLFMKIEIPEVLLWAKEQSEEMSPNLTLFTEHFNKMSYWARSRILEQEEAKDREKYLVKFIKIMKHLRRMNNFNSYLAILSALDSAPVRRLEWQKQITEGLKEYCELIDSSSSFRAYRQALAETEPPCIPYIGLILQDLTFVHIGNNDFLVDRNINFAKRWQQFNILDNMRRFKKCNYSFKANQKITAFFNNFDDYLCEEAMWQISESIKPRGGKKKVEATIQS